MAVSRFRQGIAAVLALAIGAPSVPAMARVQEDVRDKPGDGVPSAAACRPFGFTLPERRPEPVAVAGSTMSLAYA
ncbi:hypothetical protein GVN24_23845, partial [Rhizobium sp. CRIBSB]|nr:hypothetical protein [Rhizobium sp. CRIBSB]